MKFNLYIFLFFLTFSCSKTNKEIIYVGFEPIMIFEDQNGKKTNIDNENPEKKWFYKNTLKIKNDSIYLDRITINVIGNDTLHSSSDGGFYYYKGIRIEINNQTRIELTEISCDYCPETISKSGKKINRKLNGKITENGIEINDIKFKETKTSNYILRSEKLNGN